MTTVWVSHPDTPRLPMLEGFEPIESPQEADLWLVRGPIDRALELAATASPGQVIFRIENAPTAESWAHVGHSFDGILSESTTSDELAARFRAQRFGRRAKARSDMLRALAHDLNNPLTAIRLLSDVVASEIVDDECREDMDNVIEAADAAALQVESLRAYGRRDVPPTAHGAVDIVSMVRDLLQRPSLRERMALTAPDYRLNVTGDPLGISQALADLIINAKRMCSQAHDCRVSIARHDRAVVVTTLSVVSTMPEQVQLLTEEHGAAYIRAQHFPVLPTGLVHTRLTAERLGGSLMIEGTDSTLEMRLTLPMSER